jgi:hypothetical protein
MTMNRYDLLVKINGYWKNVGVMFPSQSGYSIKLNMIPVNFEGNIAAFPVIDGDKKDEMHKAD